MLWLEPWQGALLFCLAAGLLFVVHHWRR